MRKCWMGIILLGIGGNVFAQNNIQEKLRKSVEDFVNDKQLSNASLGFYVADAVTGATVFDHNGHTGLSPASTQKIFTAIAAYELLGQDYRFKTLVGYRGTIESGVLNGDLILTGLGDPTLGSWRYVGFRPQDVQAKVLTILSQAGIRAINGNVIVDETKFSMQPSPGGWPWNDLGNYYGAPNWGFNWAENQYGITFRPGAGIGDSVRIVNIDPVLPNTILLNRVTTDNAGTGDNSYLFSSPYNPMIVVTGTIPKGKNTTAYGSMPNPPEVFVAQLKEWFAQKQIYCTGNFETGGKYAWQQKTVPQPTAILDTLFSPPMDSIIYWFLRKSINLYGESIAKIIGWEQKKKGETTAGVGLIKEFWEKNGIGRNALHMIDGSGLSPQNYDAPMSEVNALLYAQGKPWFPAFYAALPLYNGMKMKSGTVSVCKAFTGYQTATDGKKYVFSLIVNNYNGSTDALVNKMYKVLDNLK